MALTREQEDWLQAANDSWGVARWTENADGTVTLILDDGDRVTVAPDGSEVKT